MNKGVAGYLLSDRVMFNALDGVVISYDENLSDNHINIRFVSLSKVQSRLFAYLLSNAGETPVSKDDILCHVWDNGGYSSSSQNLWRTMKDLKIKLSAIGLSESLIESARGSGYLIRMEARKLILER